MPERRLASTAASSHRTTSARRDASARNPDHHPRSHLIDLAATFGYRALRRTVREAQRNLVTIPQILETLDRLGPRRGTANLTKILATGHAPTRSELEDAVLDLILKAGFQRPDVNQPIRSKAAASSPTSAGPRQQLVIEADGAEWHDHRLAREDDAERQAILEAHGERVIRVTWAQAIAHRTQTLERIRAAGAPT